MILLLGTDAFSPFRMDAIKDAIAKADPKASNIKIDAKWVYAIDADKVDAGDLERASTLLNASGNLDKADFFVFPRKGTISPWSSKATDIFRNCSLCSIRRVERGVRYCISGAKIGAWAGVLYDKMTEGVYDKIDDLFDVDEPRPGRSYDVLTRGVDAIREADREMGLAIRLQREDIFEAMHRVWGRVC